MKTLRCRQLGLALTLLLGACAHSPSYEPQDPLEPVNRAIYGFNEVADRYVLRPVSRGYDAVTPDVVQIGVRNLLSNLFYPVTIVNQFSQGKWAQGGSDLGRFLINSTLGIGGLIDVAQHWGMPRHGEDFGQTLGSWGVGEGWYLMLPFLGPTTNRDFVGRIVDGPFSPLYYVEDPVVIYGVSALDAVQTRADLLDADSILQQQDDRYAFIRGAYLQKRQAAVRDGAPPPEDDFDALLDEL